MPDTQPTRERWPWWKWLLLPLAPVLVPIHLVFLLVFFVGALIVVVCVKPVTDRMAARRLHNAMAATGRTITWEKVEAAPHRPGSGN